MSSETENDREFREAVRRFMETDEVPADLPLPEVQRWAVEERREGADMRCEVDK